METNSSRIPLKAIQTKEEYERHKQNYEYCIQEEQWLATAENPIKEVSETLKDLLSKLDNVERNSGKEKAILKDIHVFGVKLRMLSTGIYHDVLRDNKKVETLLLNEYEIEHQMTIGKYLKGIITGEEKARELRDYRILRFSGREVVPTALDSIPKENIYIEFAELYQDSFVDIDIQQVKEQVQQQLALVPAEDVARGIVDRAEQRLIEQIEKENPENQGVMEQNNSSNSTLSEKKLPPRKVNDRTESEPSTSKREEKTR